MPQTRKIKTNSVFEDTFDNNKDDINATNVIVHHDDPIFLTESELREDLTRVLSCNNPNNPKNVVYFSYKDLSFIPKLHINQTETHFSLEPKLKLKAHSTFAENEKRNSEESKSESKKLRNQFNFSERATQVSVNAPKNTSVMTESPKKLLFSGQVSQWILNEAYEKDLLNSQQKDDDSVHTSKVEEKKTLVSQQTSDSRTNDIEKFQSSIKMIERMVNQNKNAEISHDFRYYEDESDQYRDNGSGTVLPLWKFYHNVEKKFSVTSVNWNPFYSDLLAVSYGNYEFENKSDSGMICFYSLKNVAHPEFIFMTESGVTAFDFHPKLVYIFCVGFYNGTVAIYNTKTSQKQPMFITSIDNGIHFGPVWSIKWIPTDIEMNLSFISCGNDGRITSWLLVKDCIQLNAKYKNEISSYDVSTLKLKSFENTGLEATDSALTFEINPKNENHYLVGTEEGFIHFGDKTYSGDFIKSYKAHNMPVYKVQWNPYHSDVFLSCSADWTLKVWSTKNEEPLMLYELGSSLGDACWSNYSSTVFAAVGSDGKIYVFDMNINRYEPLCSQQIVPRKHAKLTKVTFNHKNPVLAVSDNRGLTTIVKLSPNLRVLPKEKKGQTNKRGPEVEKKKLDNLIQILE